jgi:chemosensory pili system protein ChpE
VPSPSDSKGHPVPSEIAVLTLFFAAFVFGLAFNAAPGPVTAETLRRGLNGGFRPALAVQIGSLAGDLSWAVLGVAGAAALFTVPILRLPLELAGAGFLLWLAWGAWNDAAEPRDFVAADGHAASRGAVAAGAAMALSNPQNVSFWAAMVAPMAALGVTDMTTPEAFVFFGGFAASSLTWCFVAAGIVAWCRSVLTPALHRALNVGCAAALGIFGLIAILGAVRGLLGP